MSNHKVIHAKDSLLPARSGPETAGLDLETAGPTVLPSACYVAPAPAADVMHDQLDYLIRHASPSCLARCADCRRLAEVRQTLLRPFA
jgi:hypothetical protein